MKSFVCVACGKEQPNKKNTMNKFCSNRCQADHRQEHLVKKWRETGRIGKATLKRYLAETYGDVCAVCGINEWQGKPIVLELEHINGMSWDSNEDNVCLICPNCHSQTETYKGKNVGNGRHYRRVRYAEGKSY